MNSSVEFWHVQLPNGTVSTMTLDELDAAFQADTINERTYVIKQGEQAWATLADLLGLDQPAQPASATPPPVVVASPVPFASFAPPPVESAPIYSLRPVVSEVSDIDDDIDFGGTAFRSPKKRTAIIFGSIASVAAVGLLVAVLSASSSSPPVAAAASQPPPPPVAVAAPPPPVTAPAAAPAADGTATALDRFSDAQKKALMDADKTHAAQQKAKASAAASHRSVGSGYKSDSKPVFHKGGNKYDPLNSSL
jgi:hypothetical protein